MYTIFFKDTELGGLITVCTTDLFSMLKAMRGTRYIFKGYTIQRGKR